MKMLCLALVLALYHTDVASAQAPLVSPAPAVRTFVELERLLVTELARHSVRLQALESRTDQQAAELLSLKKLLKSKQFLQTTPVMAQIGQTPAVTSSLRPVRGETSTRGTAVLYSLSFDADVKPDVTWRQNGRPVFPADPSVTVMTSFNGSAGETRFRTEDATARVTVTLADKVKSFTVTFSTTRFATGEQEINPCDMRVTPSDDVVYKPGDDVTFTVVTSAGTAASPEPTLSWNLWVPDASKTPVSLKTFASPSSGEPLSSSPVKVAGQPGTGATVTLTTGQFDRGLLALSCSLRASVVSAPVLMVTETRFTSFRPEGQRLSFPDNFFSFQEETVTKETQCKAGQPCTLSCSLFGKDAVVSLQRAREAGKHSPVDLPSVSIRQSPLLKLVLFQIQSYLPSTEAGDYVCSAAKGGRVQERKFSVVTVEDVKILPNSGIGQTALKQRTVTCSATGQPLPTVTLYENFAFGPQVTSGQHYQVATSKDSALGIATVRVTIVQPRAGVTAISCVGHNAQHLAMRDFPLLLAPTTPSWEFPPLAPPLRPAPAPMLSQTVI